MTSPALKFNDDVDGAPLASPGRIDKKPSAVGPTTVAFNNTPVAPAGTAAPVTCNFCDTGDTNGPGKPTSVRVSKMRTGSIITTDDAGPDAAFATNNPPPPIETATAAPIAAHLALRKRVRPPEPDKFISASCERRCRRGF